MVQPTDQIFGWPSWLALQRPPWVVVGGGSGVLSSYEAAGRLAVSEPRYYVTRSDACGLLHKTTRARTTIFRATCAVQQCRPAAHSAWVHALISLPLQSAHSPHPLIWYAPRTQAIRVSSWISGF